MEEGGKGEEEQEGRGEPDNYNVGSGSVHQLDINEVDTYGFWDQSLDIMPAMSRYIVVFTCRGDCLYSRDGRN